MEIASFAQEQRDRFSPRMPSDVSVTSNSSAKVQSSSSFDSATNARDKRVKLMCSYGGRILPRPSDRRLRYVGGETRMVSVPRHIQFEALLRKLTEIYGPDLTLKYQLPEEDLDALVSVTLDEDLENMMDECDRLESLEGASRLRVFVFSPKDMVSLDLTDIADPAVSELRYVDAVNTVQVEASFKKSNDSNNSFGHPPSGWHTPRVYQDSLHPSADAPAFYASKSDDMSNFVSPPPPMVTVRQQTAPLEFISIQATDKGGYYGPGAGGDDFRDLESGGSASSSTSSQHDLYNRLQWTSRSQKQPHAETSPCGSQWQDSQSKGNTEDLPKKTEQMHIRINKEKRAQEIEMDVTGTSVLQPERISDQFMQFYHTESADEAQEIAANFHGQVPLSPGAKLQRQLESDRDSSKPRGVEIVEFVPDVNKTQPLKPSQGQQQIVQPLIPFQDHAVNKLLYADDLIPNFLHTQVFEPLNNQQHSEGSLSPAQSAIVERQHHDTGKAFSALTEDEAKQHELSMHLPKDLLHTDYISGLYSENDKESNNVSIFASQPFPKEPYNTVFQTCSSEIPLASMDGVDELLQQVLSPTMNFTDQSSVDGYHIGINSQAPWHSPDRGSFSLLCQGNGSTLEMSSNPSDHISTESIRTPRTQNYENVQGRPPLLSELYLQGGESNVVNIASMPADSLEELDTVDKASGALPMSNSRDRLQTETTIESNRASSLSSFVELGDKHNDVELGLSYAAVGLTELSLDDSRDTLMGLHQVLDSLKGLVLQQDSVTEADYNLVRADDEIGSLTLQSLSTTAPAAPSLLEVWSTTAQSEHETHSAMLQNFNHEKDIEIAGSASIMEKDMTIDDQRSEVDDFDTFQSAADRSMNPAAAAEVEAIARGLQIIRYCDLEELRELGSGTFGTVYHGKWRGTDIAIKRIKSSCFTGRPAERDRLIADFWREAYILGQLHHPNVVAFYGVVPDGPGGTLATVTEYMVNGSLKQALQKKDRTLDRRKRLLIAMDVAFGMEYLHGKNVVHFDIKCENLLVNLRDLQRPICKVGDLGLSKVKQQTMVSGGVRGTLPWMAPELLNGSSSLVSEKVDVFSFGIVLWELLTGEEPYASMHYGAIIGGIVSNTLRPPVPRWCDHAYRSLMETCWSADPSVRPTFSEIARRLRVMEAALGAKAPGQAPATG